MRAEEECSAMNDMLDKLRAAMRAEGCDGYFIPRSDMFGGEEVRPADERLARLTGFTGSAGYALILQERAAVFSDSRYKVQLQRQLDPNLYAGFDTADMSLSDWLVEAADGLVIGYDGWTLSAAQAQRLSETIGVARWQMVADNLVDNCWDDRPDYNRGAVWQMPDRQAGKTAQDKIQDVVETLKLSGAEACLITAPDSVNWLLNLRGRDLDHTPFHLCFALVDKAGDVTVLGADEALAAAGYTVIPIAQIDRLLDSYEGKLLAMDKASCPQAVKAIAEAAKIQILWQADTVQTSKAVKSDAEIDGFRAAHITDAVSFIAFWHWLETEADLSTLCESDLAVRLTAFRAQNADYICDSFPAIVGLNENGAVVHYRAMAGADAALSEGGVLLIDSGAHYRSGTTDITRTFSLGGAAPEAAIKAATHVLAAHITLAQAQFPPGTTGAQLDAMCRMPLWAQALDYGHGTGHGVGHVLSVHEGPVSISKRCQLPIEAGHILSNEPGFYQEGAFGIRHETLILAQPHTDGFLRFETLTYVPFDTGLIDVRYLTSGQIGWINEYHQTIYEMLSPFLPAVTADWLRGKTQPLPFTA